MSEKFFSYESRRKCSEAGKRGAAMARRSHKRPDMTGRFAQLERRQELQRLRDQVVEKARAWNELIGIPSTELTLAECALAEAVDQFEAFESKISDSGES